MMIKNERQYRITRAQADKFAQAVAQMHTPAVPAKDMHPLLQKAQQEALQSQLDDLRREIAEYEDLRQGRKPVTLSGSFDELPRTLIRARIASGLSQKELAERLGVKEQQVQRYEATEYSSASLERVRAVIRALGVTVREEVSLSRS